MRCLRAQGQGSEAIEVYRRCRQMLRATAGIVPTPETERTYREISVP
jgi:DNA-binding SARP family transcriptional activator